MYRDTYDELRNNAMRNNIQKFEIKVLKFLDDQKLFERGDALLLGISGGADSISLLSLMSKWAKVRGWKIKVAYFDHLLRKDSKRESAHIKKECQKLKVPFIEGRGDVKRLKESQKLSLEEAARKLRYDFLRKEAKKFKNAKIVVAHHLNDQVETFFVQLLKGAGLGGLSGMSPDQFNIVRPLLCVTKSEIEEYLKAKKIKFFLDKTNRSEKIVRNKVRRKLLPYLERQFDFNLLKTIPKLMTILKEEHLYLEQLAQAWRRTYLRRTAEGVYIETGDFRQLPKALQRRVIKITLDQLSVQRNYSSLHVERNRELFYNPNSHKVLMLPDGVRVKKLKKSVFFSKIEPSGLLTPRGYVKIRESI